MDPDSGDLFREPIVYRSIALDFAAVEAPANGSNTASASASAAGTAPTPFALGKTFAPHYASSAVAASSFTVSEQPSFADFADPHGSGESAYRVLYAKPAYESPPLSQPQPSFTVDSGATRLPSSDAKVIPAASTSVANHASVPTGQACPLPSNFERAWSLVVAPLQQQEQQPPTFISAGELCSALEAAIEFSSDDDAADEQRPAEGDADMSAIDRMAALRLRRARLRSVVVQRVDMDSFAVCLRVCALIFDQIPLSDCVSVFGCA
jgi:hypothetical protein